MTVLVAINGRYKFKPQSGMNSWSSQVSGKLLKMDSLEIEYRIFEPGKFFRTGILGHLWEQLILPFRAKNSDFIFCPSNFGPIISRKALVVIHDVIPISHPELFNRFYSNCTKYLTSKITKRAKLILTVSTYSKESLIDYFNVDPQKISVVGAGVKVVDSSEHYSVTDSKFFLFIGGDNLRKNLDFLLDIWELIYLNTGVKLVVTTQGRSKTYSNFKVPTNEFLVVVHKPSDEMLRYFYKNCIALLWPSIVEGFGLPLLEVMAQGRPFLSLNTGVAEDLTVNQSQVLPAKKTKWQYEIFKLCSTTPKTDPDQIAKAMKYSWELVSRQIDDSIREHSRK